MRRHFRASQKHVERDFTALSKAAKEAAKRKDITPEEAIQALESMITKVEGLSAKVCAVRLQNVIPHFRSAFRCPHEGNRAEYFHASKTIGTLGAGGIRSDQSS